MDDPETFGAALERIWAEACDDLQIRASAGVPDWLTAEFTADIETDGSDWEDPD